MPSSVSPRLCIVGSINADLFVHVDRHPSPGETLLGSGGEVLPGGKGANQAVAAALQGAQVTFVGAVGDDAYSGPAMQLMRESGVDCADIETIRGTTGLAVITVSADGENSIIVVPGANYQVTEEFVARHATAIATANLVLLQGEIPASGFAEAIRTARGRVIVNLAPVVEVDRDCLLRADPLVVNEHEAGLVLGADGTPDQLLRGLIDAGFKSVVMTLGKAGALVAEGDTITKIPTPTITAVDTTGAGDAFTGALAARLLAGSTLIAAAQHAARVGAYAAMRPGAQPSYPSATDLLPEV
ncbi:ribokinase [Staphylococcus chromogenes]|nr:ribokinase [Staphylococcus chromogenes]